MKKAATPELAHKLGQIPNIGPAMVSDLMLLGITSPPELMSQDAYTLYVQLCNKTRTYHDPCVLDTLLAAIDFMNGGKPKPWWAFTETRKQNFACVKDQIAQWR